MEMGKAEAIGGGVRVGAGKEVGRAARRLISKFGDGQDSRSEVARPGTLSRLHPDCEDGQKSGSGDDFDIRSGAGSESSSQLLSDGNRSAFRLVDVQSSGPCRYAVWTSAPASAPASLTNSSFSQFSGFRYISVPQRTRGSRHARKGKREDLHPTFPKPPAPKTSRRRSRTFEICHRGVPRVPGRRARFGG